MNRRTTIRWSAIKIGVVVTVALTLLALTILNMGRGLSFLTQQDELRVIVPHTHGLKVGGPVRLNGVDTGNVRAIGLAPGSTDVEIRFSMKRSLVGLLHDDATATIKPLGLLGDKFLDISPGSPHRPPFSPVQPLTGQAETDFTGLTAEADSTLKRLNEAMASMQRVLSSLTDGQGTAGKLVTNTDLYDRSERLLQSLEDAANKGTEVLAKVERGEGTLGRFVTDRSFFDRADQALKDVSAVARRLNSQNGTLVKLSNPEFFQRLETLTTQGEHLLAKLQHGEGTIGKLIKDDELYARADRLLTDIEALVEDVKRNPKKYFKLSLF